MSNLGAESSVKTAIIPMAGEGTGMWPASMTTEKAMLNVGHFTVADFIINNCADAGIENVILVVSPGSSQIQEHFAPQEARIDRMRARGKDAVADRLASIGRGMRIRFVEQDMAHYGTAVPFHDALRAMSGEVEMKDAVGNTIEEQWNDEAFLALMGDDWLHGGHDIATVIAMRNSGQFRHVALGNLVPDEDVEKYGIFDTDDRGYVIQIVEKPKPTEITSRNANLGKLVLDRELMDEALRDYMKTTRTKEYYLTDVVTTVAALSPMPVVPIIGKHLDAGNETGMWNCWNTVLGPKYGATK